MAESKNYWGQIIPQGNFEAYGHYSMNQFVASALTAHTNDIFQLRVCGGVQAGWAWPALGLVVAVFILSLDIGTLVISSDTGRTSQMFSVQNVEYSVIGRKSFSTEIPDRIPVASCSSSCFGSKFELKHCLVSSNLDSCTLHCIDEKLGPWPPIIVFRSGMPSPVLANGSAL